MFSSDALPFEQGVHFSCAKLVHSEWLHGLAWYCRGRCGALSLAVKLAAAQGVYGKCVRVIKAYACLGEMALLELHSSNRRSATAVAAEESHTIVVPKALYDAVLRTKQSAEMRAKFRIFAHIDWLASLPEADRKNVGYAMGLALWPQGAVIATRGSEFQGVMLLQRGSVAILRGKGALGCDDGSGKGSAAGCVVRCASSEMEVVGRRWAGEMFGEQALLHGGLHPHTIIAETPAEVFCLSLSVRPSTHAGRVLAALSHPALAVVIRGNSRLVYPTCLLATRETKPGMRHRCVHVGSA